MHRLAAPLIGLALSSATLVAVPQTATAAAGCVSRHEFYALAVGMSVHTVHSVTGAAGTLKRRHGNREALSYPICRAPGAKVTVHFKRTAGVWRLTSKSADAE